MIVNHRLPGFGGVLAVMALLVAACSGGAAVDPGAVLSVDETTDPTVLGTTTETVEPTTTEVPPNLSGSLEVQGSSTVNGITDAVVAGFAERQPNVSVSVAAEGSSAGFDALCKDSSVSVIGSSRAISGTEGATCLSNGVLPIEMRLARDGIAVIVNNASSLQCLSYQDLYALMGPESTGLTSLESVGALASELGSSTEWGSGEVHVVVPGPAHGTHQLFADFALAPIAAQRGVGTFMRVDSRNLDSDAQLVEAIASDPFAIGFVGSSFPTESAGLVKSLGVSDGSGCVLPNDAAVVQGLYPMSRDLYLYADGATDDPIVDDFVTYYVDIVLADAVAQAEYVALSPAEQAETAARWRNR